MSVIVKAANFEAEVLKSDKLVLVYFDAPSTGRLYEKMKPIVDEIADEHPEYKVCMVNVNEENQLADRLDVAAVPMFIVFEYGKAVSDCAGLMHKAELLRLLKGEPLFG